MIGLFTFLLGVVGTTTAFAADGEQPIALNLSDCVDSADGVCGGCSNSPEMFTLGTCQSLDSKSVMVAFRDFYYYSASCNADNTFSLTRYPNSSCIGGVTTTGSVGCVTRHVVARFTAVVEKTSSGSIKFLPTLKMCESLDKSCPADCSDDVLPISKRDRCESAGGGQLWSKLSYTINEEEVEGKKQIKNVNVSLQVLDFDCRNLIASFEPTIITPEALKNVGICLPLTTLHKNTMCVSAPSTDTTPTTAAPDNSPLFVGGSLHYKDCMVNTIGVCAGCPRSPVEFALDKCQRLKSVMTFRDFGYYSASCNADNTFSLTRYPNPQCQEGGVTTTGSVGCFTRYIVGRFTGQVEKSKWNIITKVKGVLNMCESDDQQTCPKDCSDNFIKIRESNNGCIYPTAPDGYYYSVKFTTSLSYPNIELSLDVWNGQGCRGEPLFSLNPTTVSLASFINDGICFPITALHREVQCVPASGSGTTTTTALESSPLFVGGSLHLDSCTNNTCGDCSVSPEKFELKNCQAHESVVAFQNFEYYSASCNETDNTFILTRYSDSQCEGDGVTTTGSVGCVTRHVVGKVIVNVEKDRWNRPKTYSAMLGMCESDTQTCPKDCSVSSIALKEGKYCRGATISDTDFSYTFVMSVNASHINVSLDLWSGRRCDGDALVSIAQESLPLETLLINGICIPISTHHWDVKCVPLPTTAASTTATTTTISITSITGVVGGPDATTKSTTNANSGTTKATTHSSTSVSANDDGDVFITQLGDNNNNNNNNNNSSDSSAGGELVAAAVAILSLFTTAIMLSF